MIKEPTLLPASENVLKSAMDSYNAGIILTDSSGNICFINLWARLMLGYGESDQVNTIFDLRTDIDYDDWEQHKHAGADETHRLRLQEEVWRFKKKEGIIVTLSVCLSLIPAPENTFVCIWLREPSTTEKQPDPAPITPAGSEIINDRIVFKSKDFQKVMDKIALVSKTDSPVLILGETGTGKELVGHLVHINSLRKNGPFIKINCSNLPSELIESELFGHEKGAFTGAHTSRAGRFEEADGGTIFLDEIGEMNILLQAKLLRVLQEGEFERLGGNKTIKVRVRVIAATNRNLEEAIYKNTFRADLYYRLKVFPIHLSPLRERPEDIPVLAHYFINKVEIRTHKKIKAISERAMQALVNYSWPGNARELEHTIEQAVILTQGDTIEPGEWIPREREKTDFNFEELPLADLEKQYILWVLRQKDWKVSGKDGAAESLQINATTLEAKMKKLGIRRECFSY